MREFVFGVEKLVKYIRTKLCKIKKKSLSFTGLGPYALALRMLLGVTPL